MRLTLLLMADVVEINDLRSLSGLRLVWDSLLADTPAASFFHTYDWLETYWRHFGTGRRLRVLEVRAGGETVGIVPLCVGERQYRLGTTRVLGYPLDNWGAFYGPIGKNQTATLLMAMRHLARAPRDWNLLELAWTGELRAGHGRTRAAMLQAGLTPRVESCKSTSLIDLDAFTGWDDYLVSRPRKVRHELRRTLRRVEEWGEVEVIRHRPDARRAGDGDPRWDLYDECEEVARASWQANSADGNTLCHARYASFYRDAHAAAARLGMVDMAVLRLAGRPVAFWYGYRYGRRVLGLRMGYRQDAPIGGTGMALLARLVEDSFARGDELFDLGPGDEKYKERLRTSAPMSYCISHTPRTSWRPQLARGARWLRQRLAG